MIVAFTQGIDQVLPKMLRTVELDDGTDHPRTCSGGCSVHILLPLQFPCWWKRLRRPQNQVRFIAAHLLSRIGPPASAAVPAILPLLDERFEPSSSWEREHPEGSDPAVAATWAPGAIAPGTEMAATAEAALMKLLQSPEYPWRHPDARWAVERLSLRETMIRPARRGIDVDTRSPTPISRRMAQRD